jgi:2-polyprenyl-3-methyl-5-hydroxy-6-metoxy-1,4-benzoquinol methylase
MHYHKNCPVCKSETFNSFLDCKDYTVSKETFSIVSCKACGFKFTNPIPELTNLGNYYKSEDYISHSNTKKGLISQLYHLVRNFTLKQKLKLVANHVSRGTVLDYGCGTGMFLNTCQNAGWEAYGMEPDSGARKIAEEMQIRVFGDKNELLLNLGLTKLNAITLWHVLEHVTDLPETLHFFKEQLSKEGVLIIAVPNHQSYDAQFYGKFWAAYDVPRHLYHFDKDSMERLLGSYGFKLIETKPMKFDSFYVSMLSEKYKTGSINYFKAFYRGFVSNLKARASLNNSSLIYVFKHK